MSSLPTKPIFLDSALTLEIQAICDRKFLRFRRGPCPPVGCATKRAVMQRTQAYSVFIR